MTRNNTNRRKQIAENWAEMPIAGPRCAGALGPIRSFIRLPMGDVLAKRIDRGLKCMNAY